MRDELPKPADERRNRAELGSGKPRLDPDSAHARRTVRPQVSRWVNQDESPSGDRELLMINANAASIPAMMAARVRRMVAMINSPELTS